VQKTSEYSRVLRASQARSFAARFARAGDDLVVTTRIRIDVRLLFVTIYRFESDGREVWRDGRLVRFETTTNDNGAKATVKAWAMGDKFVIERPDGRLTTNDRIYTTHAWNRALVGSPVLLEPTSGKLYMVGFADGGDVKLAGSPARTYAIAGEIEGRLWYAPDGTWLRMDLVKHGGIVSVTLTSAPARKGVAVARRPGAPTAGATASGT